jgi:chromosomal replication initiation ATPase DnaA
MYQVPDGETVFGISAALRQKAYELAEELRRQETKKGRKRLSSRFAPEWVVDIVEKVSHERGVSLLDIIGPSRHRLVVAARHQAIYEIMRMKPTLSSPIVGRWFDRDHSAVLYAAAKHATINDLDPVVGFDAQAKLCRNAAYNAKMRAMA